MKIKLDKDTVKKVVVWVVLALFVAVVLTNLFYNYSLTFLNETFNYSLINLSLVSTLKILTGFFEFLRGFSEIIDKIFNYFLVINFLIFSQTTLLKLSSLIVVRLVILLVFVLTFIKPLRSLFIKILIVLFFFNPGLSIYVSCIKVVSDSVNLELGKNVNTKFEELNNILKKDDLLEPENSKTNNKNFFENTKEFFKDPVKNLATNIKEKLSLFITYTSKLLQVAIELSIVYFVNTMILFFALPVIYFFVLYLYIRRSFFKNSIIVLEKK